MQAFFVRKSFMRQVISKDEVEGEWKSITLCMCDSIGGSSGNVIVDMKRDGEIIYLKTVEKLPKAEFETLFHFKCGEFLKDRIIAISSDVLSIV